MKYAERLLQSEEEQKEVEVTRKVKMAQLKLEADITETSYALVKAEEKVEQLKSADNIDFNAIVEAMEEVEGYKKGMEALEALKKELF